MDGTNNTHCFIFIPNDTSMFQFRWTFGNETFGEEDITLDGMTSYISVNALKENFGTYICYVKNRMGDGLPCELEVTGKTLL